MTGTNDQASRDRQQEIAADLRALILAGDLRPGDKLPTTSALMAQYDVVDRTVQRALDILKAERFVRGEKGRGVFVTANQPVPIRASHYPQPAADGQPYPWLTDTTRRDRVASIDLLAVGECPAPAQVAAAYGVEKGDSVVYRNLLLKLDGEPAELVWSYYRPEIAQGTALAEPNKIKGGTPALFASMGRPLGKAVDQISARLATVEEFAALKLPQTMPILRQFRVVYTRDGDAIEVTVMIKAAQAYELQYELPADHT